MAWCKPGDKPLSEPMMVRLPMHICITWPQWVNLTHWTQAIQSYLHWGTQFFLSLPIALKIWGILAALLSSWLKLGRQYMYEVSYSHSGIFRTKRFCGNMWGRTVTDNLGIHYKFGVYELTTEMCYSYMRNNDQIRGPFQKSNFSITIQIRDWNFAHGMTAVLPWHVQNV